MSLILVGIASPNPDYPQKINTFTGENFVEICGSQLFDKSDLIGGWIRSYDGLYFNQYTTTYGCTPFIPVKPSTAYTLNLSNQSGLGSAGVCYYDMNKNWTYEIPENVKVINFTTNSDTKYIRFTVRQDAKSSVQLLEGTYTEQTMPSYEAYKSQRKEINLGKNLFDYTKISSVSNGTNNEGVIASTTTAQEGILNVVLWFANGSFVVPKGSKVYFSADIKLTEGSTGLFSRINDGYVGNQETILHPVLSTEYQRYQTATTYSSETKIQSMLIQFTNLLGSAEIKNIMISFSDDVKFEPYFEPIELCAIGNYKDYIRKGTGKNLINPDLEIAEYNASGVKTSTTVWLVNKYAINVSPNTTYVVSQKEHPIQYRMTYFNGTTFVSQASSTQNTTTGYSSYSFTTPANCNRLFIQFRSTVERIASGSPYVSLSDINLEMVEKGTTPTIYEPYGYKGKWYKYGAIGKETFNGTEVGWTANSMTNTWGYRITRYFFKNNSGNSNLTGYKMNYFSEITPNQSWNGDTNLKGFCVTTDNNIRINIGDTTNKLTDFLTWMGTHNLVFYYVASEPTITEITEENYPILYQQLQDLENGYTYEGTTNIIFDNFGKMSISVDKPYREPVDTITAANYLMDFTKSRDYGPVNKVQITLEGIEDAEYIENSDSIYREGIQTITINDNYFMGTIDARKASIGILWNALYRMKYLPAKFTYLGYPYLEMGDFISIVLPDGTIKNTYIFNYEFVYNGGYMGTIETPTISRTQEEYPTDGLDLRISRMGINVDRANGRITAEIIAREEADETIMGEYVPNAVFNDYQTTLTQTIDQINTSVSAANTVLYGENDDGLISQVNQNATEISQTADSITAIVRDVSTVTSQVDSLEENTQDVVNQLQFTNEGLTISNKGSTSEDMKLNLTNEAINFMYRNNVVLKINGSEIEFTNASFRKLDLGNFVWLAEEDGSLSLIYEGGNS